MEVLTLQTRVYYPYGSINITNTSLCTQMDVLHYKHYYIAQMEVLTLQTRVYNTDGSINITNTSI